MGHGPRTARDRPAHPGGAAAHARERRRGRPKSKRALEEAQAADNRVLLVVQREPRVDDPAGEDLYLVGTLCVVKQVIRLPDDTLQVLVEGRERARIDAYLPGPTLRAQVTTIVETNPEKGDPRAAAVADQVKSAFGDYAQQNKHLRLDSFHLENLKGLKEPGPLADVVAKYATWDVADKQASSRRATRSSGSRPCWASSRATWSASTPRSRSARASSSRWTPTSASTTCASR
jgi:ATP-dependent Lon protease